MDRQNKGLTIFVDAQPLVKHKSGVGKYIENIIEKTRAAHQDVHPVYTAFASTTRAVYAPENAQTKIIRFPQRVYLELLEKGINIPIDTFFDTVYDIYFFGNYFTYPRKKGKAITVIHDLCFLHYPEFVERHARKYLTQLVPKSIQQSDAIVTVSETMKDELIAAYKLDGEKISVIPPVIQSPQFSAKAISEKKYILYTGTIDPRKNILFLLQAYLKLPRSLKNVYHLVIAGGLSGNQKEVIACIHENKEWIEYMGYVSEEKKSRLYACASAFVFPSLYEGFGIPVLEAMAYRVPVIISDIPVFHEIAGSDNALFFNPHQEQELTACIQSILTHAELCGMLADKAGIRAEKYIATAQEEILFTLCRTLSS